MSNKGKAREMPGKPKHHKPSEREESLQTTKEQMVISHKRAQKIFLNLSCETVSLATFKKLVRYINPDIYEHIVLDRGATSFCGYPLCPKQISDTLGERTYKIHQNKVYDISMRKNFCSNVCYEASEIVRGQISCEPLYLRERSPEIISDVRVPVLENLRGLHGKLVDISGGLHMPFRNQEKHCRPFTSFTEIAEDSLKMCAENKEHEQVNNGKHVEKKNSFNNQHQDKAKDGDQQMKSHPLASHKDEATHKWRQGTEDLTNQNKEEKFNTLTAVLKIERDLRQWMTFDSMRFILGDLYVRGMLEAFGQNFEDFDTTAGMKLGVEAKGKYIALCRKLDEEEIDERAQPGLNINNIDDQPKQPLPNYQQLQDDAKKQKLKVVSFLGGQDQYEDGTSDPSNEGKDEDNESSFPLIDSYSQNEWRQAIVFDKFVKYMRPILLLGQLEESKIHLLIKTLLLTFKFSPNNIIFKPGQWNLVTLIILKMLSIRIPAIKYGMEKEEFCVFQETLLSTFNLDARYLDRFISYVTELKYIIRESSTSDESNNSDGKLSNETVSMVEETLAENLSKMSVMNTDADKKKESSTHSENLASDCVVDMVSSVAEDLD